MRSQLSYSYAYISISASLAMLPWQQDPSIMPARWRSATTISHCSWLWQSVILGRTCHFIHLCHGDILTLGIWHVSSSTEALCGQREQQLTALHVMASAEKNGQADTGTCTASEAEWLRSVVEREGREARNLVAWNVPAHQPSEENDGQDDSGEFVPVLRKRRAKQINGKVQNHSKTFHAGRPILGSAAVPGQSKLTVRRHGVAGQTRDGRSAMATSHLASRQQPGRKNGSRTDRAAQAEAQLWGRLCDQLQRSVDELYHVCEADESKLKCQVRRHDLLFSWVSFLQLLLELD